jgi:RNA polymerase sigma factor (sigma-70 family)
VGDAAGTTGRPAARPTREPLGPLVAGARAGRQADWDALVTRLGPLVWSVARATRISDADAADVSQTVWLRLVENLDRIHDPEALPGWLATASRREALRIIARNGREIPVDDLHDVDDDASDGDPARATTLGAAGTDAGPEAALLASERDVEVWTALGRLRPRCQELLRLLVGEPPLAYADVAATLGMPIGSIGPIRARCLRSLRSALLEVQGVTAEAVPAPRSPGRAGRARGGA